jgi:hypothetical protein
MKTLSGLPGLALAGSLMWLSGSAWAQSAEQIEAARQILAKCSPSELSAKCVELIANAPGDQRVAVGAALGHAVAKVNAAVTPTAVTAISRRVPEVAPATAAAAAAEVPDSAAVIAYMVAAVPRVNTKDLQAALIAAAPGEASLIAFAVADGRANRP